MRLIAAFLILTVFVSTAALADDKPVRSITVTGQTERKVVPDEAHVNVNVNAVNMKMETAKSEHDQKLRKVIDIAKKAGIDEAQIKTRSANVQPRYSYENSSRVFKGYQVTTSLDITVKKISSVGEVLEKLMGAGLESKADTEWMGLANVSYTISNPNKLRDEMTTEAIKNAREKAERMASAAGASLGVVYQVSEGNVPQFNYPRPMPMMAMAARGAQAEMASDAMSPPPGEQEVSTTVTVMYELK